MFADSLGSQISIIMGIGIITDNTYDSTLRGLSCLIISLIIFLLCRVQAGVGRHLRLIIQIFLILVWSMRIRQGLG